jgi:hypothetical protein
MNTGGYDPRLMQDIKRFNGGLFKDRSHPSRQTRFNC